jgi:hypothetical protein
MSRAVPSLAKRAGELLACDGITAKCIAYTVDDVGKGVVRKLVTSDTQAKEKQPTFFCVGQLF